MPAARAAFGHAGPVRHRKITIDPPRGRSCFPFIDPRAGITLRLFLSISSEFPRRAFSIPFLRTLFPTRKRFHLFLGERGSSITDDFFNPRRSWDLTNARSSSLDFTTSRRNKREQAKRCLWTVSQREAFLPALRGIYLSIALKVRLPFTLPWILICDVLSLRNIVPSLERTLFLSFLFFLWFFWLFERDKNSFWFINLLHIIIFCFALFV